MLWFCWPRGEEEGERGGGIPVTVFQLEFPVDTSALGLYKIVSSALAVFF